MTKIILDLKDVKLQDLELRNIVEKLWNRVQELNERTKRQTKQIQEIQRKLKIEDKENA